MNTNSQTDAVRSRWTLEGRIPLSGVAEDSVWHRARSISTGEDVVLFIVRGEAALEAADAVRRAYLVEDPHLLAVRDIVVLDDPRETDAGQPVPESPHGPTTVVEYELPPAPPLAALLADGPVHPETARAIIGEAATGLEAARRRGVRHQLLDSNRVFVDVRSGAVVLLGVGVEAAAHAGLDRSREAASFQDTVSLVALLYRSLTGRSPQHDAQGNVPLPSTLVDSPIPRDLDLLCDLVLNESADEIPETTRELIEALEPWQSIPVTLEAYGRAGGRAGAGAAAAAPAPTVAPDAGDAAPVAPVAAAAAAVGTSVAEPASEDDMESTVLMSAVPDSAPEATPTAEAAAEPEVAPEPEVTPDAGTAADPEPEPVSVPESDIDDELPEDDTVVRPARAPEAAAVSYDDMESTALMSAVPGADAAFAATGAAAAAAANAPGPVPAAVPEPDADADAEDEDELPEDDTVVRPAAAVSAQQAKALVEELHLDEKRATSAFPGHLDLAGAPQPASEPAPAPAPAPSAAPAAAAGAAAAAAASAGTGAPATPARTSGSHWPVPAAAGSDAPLAPAPAPRQPSPQVQRPAADSSATTPDHSAPTPSEPVLHSAEAAPTAPVAVTGRTTSLAPSREHGPIVIQGRERSLLDEPPVENTFPSAHSSLLRDVVAVAVDRDAPQTYAMGPQGREKRSLQSQWIIIGGALAVMIALVIALTTITSDLRDILSASPTTAQGPATPQAEETGEAQADPPADEPEETKEALPAAELSGIELSALPGGADPDHTDQQERLDDGDPSTFWSTQHYANPQFGGVKEGVGFTLAFAEESTLTAVNVTTARNSGGTLELRAVTAEGGPGDVLASGAFAGDGEVRLELDEPIEAESVMLWISELPPDSNEQGRFRARIAEITVE